MITMTLAEAAQSLTTTATPPKDGETRFNGISIDTRTLQAGNLFVAIKGEKVNGHDYLDQALKKGAAGAIVDSYSESPLPQLIVKDTTVALGQLSSTWRNQFDLIIAAVTGSNGKTTLKDMIALIMAAACDGNTSEVLSTQGTLNNHWGLPMTLALLNKKHKYAVIEMGMNHFGEIEYLTQMTRPNVAVITNAAAAHLEGLGDVAGVARAKAEIFSGLQEKGIAVLNRDDAFFTFWHGLINNHSLMTFGFHPDADVRASIHQATEIQYITLHTPQGEIDVYLPLMGKHNVLNALAATATALAINIDLSAIKTGLEKMKPAHGRLELHTLINGVKIIDDSYNANPFSLQAAVNILSAFDGKKILVLGDMKELGDEAKRLHQTAGESIREAGIDYLFTYGDLSSNASQAFGQGAYHFNEQEKLVQALKPFLFNKTTILVKGSRSMRMENVVNQLIR